MNTPTEIDKALKAHREQMETNKYRLVKHTHYLPTLWDVQVQGKTDDKWYTLHTDYNYSDTNVLAWIKAHLPGIEIETIVCKFVGNR